MRIHISPANGSTPKITTFLGQALPNVEVAFDGLGQDGYDVVARLEVSEFDGHAELPQILELAGRNIAQATVGEGNRVLCYVERHPEIRWANDPDKGW